MAKLGLTRRMPWLQILLGTKAAEPDVRLVFLPAALDHGVVDSLLI